MAKSLKQLLGFDYLSSIITSPEGGVPNVWPEQFFSLTKPINGDTAAWGVVANSRQNSRTVNYGSASRKRENVDTVKRTSKCLHSFEHVDHDLGTLVMLQDENNPNMRSIGAQYLERQAAEFRRRFDNTRVSAVNSILRYGAIYLNANGDILPSSSGATQTIDFGRSANNFNQLNGIIAASWATAGTDILSHLAALQVQAVKNGRPIKYAYYGSAIPGFLTGNTNIKELMKSDALLTSQLRQNKIPAGFGIENIEWRPLYTSFFQDANGTNQDWFASDNIVFLPEITRDIYEIHEGQYAEPTNSGSSYGDASAASRGLKMFNGMGSWAKITDDPPTVRQWAADTFLPVFYDPTSVFTADVVP